ncbi:septation protein IspZ [Permianibacter sp. IMCC34836]|uniref:inner membrane-spanning protein YciB n=1 Tax=Permianibacter fluminis TaxID=2738515 RepID=UPI001553DA14|nr:inner membrane-spanning protein YciB [Permianibacter fluminis]NQD37091.1 septation protein IspZ [Permianibacter fluminis]
MLKFLLDFFPLLAFFVSYKMADIYTAVAVLMIATTIQTVGNRLLSGKWQKLHLIGLAIALLFGGLTLILHDDRFIKWKVTVFFWLLAVVFIAGATIRRSPLKALFESMNEQTLPVPAKVWMQVDLIWGVVSALIGGANLYVAFHYPLDTWVNFKVWGITVLQILLFVYTGYALYRFMPQEADSDSPQPKE